MKETGRSPFASIVFWLLVGQLSPAVFTVSPGRGALIAAEHPGSAAGTIRSLDPKAGTLELLTGCGHGLRILSVTVTAETKIIRGAATLKSFDLGPGMIVRLQLRREGEKSVATSIEVVEPGGAR